jgi:cleavage and polyadenylation specificity factor subunit 3
MSDFFGATLQTSDNPFKLRFVTEVKSPGRLDDTGPCVVLATPSMLQSGLSRQLFDAWCEDARNGIIICDFAVQGTLAREIQGTPSHILTKAGAKVQLPLPFGTDRAIPAVASCGVHTCHQAVVRTLQHAEQSSVVSQAGAVQVPLRMSVDVISFSAHADFRQTSGFIEALDPAHVVLVHGEAVEMGRLRKVPLFFPYNDCTIFSDHPFTTYVRCCQLTGVYAC